MEISNDEIRQFSIRALRIDKKMSQQDIADRFGVTRQTVARWESGEVEVNGLVLHAFANLLDVNIDLIRVNVTN